MRDMDPFQETYAPPRVHDVLIRDRLDARLDAAEQIPLILVHGQAAQGKSTLIASYLNRWIFKKESLSQPRDAPHSTAPPFERRAIWLHIDHRESSGTLLFDRIFKALASTLSPTHPPMENIGTDITTLGTGDATTRQVEILHALCAVVPSSVVLVLDNLDALEHDAPSHDLIHSLVEALLPGKTPVRLILISRQHFFVDIPAIKMEHAVLRLSNGELAFTQDETRDYFTICKGIALPPDAIKQIHAATHGWAGGIALIGASLERGGDISRWPHHLTAETLNYFSHEIFDLMPEAIKSFLIDISLYDEIDADIAETLCKTPVPSANEMLHYLTTHHLFIHRLDSKGALTTYRLNTLFRNFLFKALREKRSSFQLKALNCDAARFFERREEIPRAIRHALEGENFDRAIRLIKKSATDLIIRGHLPNLVHWLNALPRDRITQDPWLFFYLTITKRVRGGRQNVTDFLTVKNHFMTRNDIRGTMLGTAFLIEAATFVRSSPAKISQWIEEGEHLLSKAMEAPRFNWAKALLWQQIAFGYIAGEVDIMKGISACRNARLLAKAIKNREIERNASIVMSFGLVRSGDMAEAETLLETLRASTAEGIYPEYRVLNQLVRIDLLMKQADFQEAERMLNAIEIDVEKFGLIFLYPKFIEQKAMHALLTGQFDAAMAVADHLSDFSILAGNRFYQALSCHIKALIHYHGSDAGTINAESSDDLFSPWRIETALSHSNEALDLFKEKGEVSSYTFLATLLNGIILMKTGRFEGSRKEVIRAMEVFCHGPSDLSHGISDPMISEARAVLALIQWYKRSWPDAIPATPKHENGEGYFHGKHAWPDAIPAPPEYENSFCFHGKKKGFIDDPSNDSQGRHHQGGPVPILSFLRAQGQEIHRFSLLSPEDHITFFTLCIALDKSQSLFSPLTTSMHAWRQKLPMQIAPLLSHYWIQSDPAKLERLKILYRHFMPKITITTLGRFSIVIGDRPLEEAAWEGNKPKLLLKAIICNQHSQTGGVAKEKLIDDLWPDSTPKSGEKNFKVTFHRLRKALEPQINADIGYSYITLEGGSVFLHPRLITLDIDRFDRLITQGEIHVARNEPRDALPLFEKAAALYHGEFLMESPYESWTSLKREALKKRFVTLLLTLARIHEEEDEPHPAIRYLKQAIAADPVNEEPYRNLMIVYADSGMTNDALSLYETCRQTLSTELDLLPDRETRQIFEKIKSLPSSTPSRQK